MKREAGILLSVTSLPSKYGIGCFDRAAYDFVDWLEKAGQSYWQILPLGAASHGGAFDSPYQAFSAFAGNPYFISLDALVEEGVLSREECDSVDFGSDPTKVDYDRLHEHRLPLLRKAYERSHVTTIQGYVDFTRENHWWLEDYALFMAVKSFFGGENWTQWPEDIRMHYGYALDYYREKLYFEIEFHKYLQYKFYEQWRKLKAYANERNIRIVGDIPIYVSPDGSDVWAHPEMFQLDENNMPTQIAGCPPDSFSAEGQVWGNPLYDWEFHRQQNYHWWVTRMWYSFKLYDVVRIDHFRGFDEYFSIPANSQKAADGHWEKGPGMKLFRELKRQLGDRAVIAEDLGYMTDSVRQLVKDSGFPNMKVLQFAFELEDSGWANEYLPHNYEPNCVIYTGTHDNETLNGWFTGLGKEERDRIRYYMGQEQTPLKWIYKKLIRLAMMSCARICIVPLQDWMGLDNSCRMNVPGTVEVNWKWRLLPNQIPTELNDEVLEVTKCFGRANWDALNRQKSVEEQSERD
ncbi:MAG: 4-alpha-glucanotransferase [Oscillospiraceae bacterium]|nr:4-alpha-glucanotransferase [Oscillospiraceae bacterium]